MAHTYDTKTAATRSNSNPRTFNHTCGSGSTLLVLTIVVDGGTARTGGAPTYNGTAMTQADQARQAASSPETTVELWYMLAPPTGSAYAISIPNSGDLYLTCETASFKAASGNKSALRAASYATGTSTNPTGPTHSSLVAGDVIVAVVGSGSDTWTSSLTETDTVLYEVDDGSYGSAAMYRLQPDGANAALGWTRNANEDWAIVSAVFKEMADLSAMGVSKASAYAVLSVPAAANVSKAVAYAVLSTEVTVAVSKAVAYAVLEPAPADDSGPMFFIF
jgi:hypothetical protein